MFVIFCYSVLSESCFVMLSFVFILRNDNKVAVAKKITFRNTHDKKGNHER